MCPTIHIYANPRIMDVMMTPVPCKRILLVDDEVAIRNLYQLSLERQGLHVFTASGVGEALKLARDLSFDVAAIDLHLLDGNGIDLMREMAGRHPSVRLLVMSGYADAPALLAETKGPVLFYQKLQPVSELVRLIKELAV